MHRQRVLTALILLPIVLMGLLFGGKAFFEGLIMVVSFLCLFEFYRMFIPDRPILCWSGMILGLVTPVLAIYFEQEVYVLFGLFLVFFFSLLLTLFNYSSLKDPFGFLCKFCFGSGYIGLCAGLTALVRYMPYGRLWIMFLLLVVFSADTGAYYIGKTFGKHKLCPAISKGKTVEGALGGLFFGVISALFSWVVFFRFFDARLLVPLSVVLVLVSQMGDLAESIMKRAFGFKDSGQLLPGHGGVFDRVDALLLAGPVLFWVLYFSEGNFYGG